MTDDALPEYDDLSKKDLLILIYAELQELNHRLKPPEPKDAPVYVCRTCHTEVSAGERETHLVEQHNAPRGIDVGGEFRETT